MTREPPPVDRVVVAAGAVALVLLAARALTPLWAPLVFAAWTAAVLDPLAGRVQRLAGGRRGVGAAACVGLVLSLLLPIGLVLNTLGRSALSLSRQVLASPEARQALETIVSPDPEGSHALDLARLVTLAREHGATAWGALRGFAGASAAVFLAVFIFFVALFQFLSSGREMWAWWLERSPVPRPATERLGGAFLETGRGLLVGAGLTALVQAVVATVAYLALGVPRAPVLGALTYVCALIPAVGTALVWAPVAVGFALKGELVRAALMGAIGALVIGSIDNVVRPLLQRWGGKLDLPAWILLLAAFGGLAAFGPAGLVLGPLSLRLAKEVLELAREAREG